MLHFAYGANTHREIMRRHVSAAAPIGTIKKIRLKPGGSVAVDAVIMEFA
jgi:hypothetical protein